MSIPVIAFFNNKGGVGKTSLVYHIAWMMADLGYRVLACDLDPQGNLTSAFLDEERLETLLEEDGKPTTIFRAIQPLKDGTGDIAEPILMPIDDGLALLPGDMAMSEFEDDLSQVWPKCLDRDMRSFRVISAFSRVMQRGAETHGADVILADLGPNLGAINRAALIASDFVVIPVGADLFSLQGLRNLGPTLKRWRRGWAERLDNSPDSNLILPQGKMAPIGYVIMQHSVRLDRPVKSYERWVSRIPKTYHDFVKDGHQTDTDLTQDNDPNRLALLKHFRSLMPMAQEARKPIFHLKPADGALGAHYRAVKDAEGDFGVLTREIIARTKVTKRAWD